MKYFVPITDEVLYKIPRKTVDKLVPYNCDYPCYHWLLYGPPEASIDSDTAKKGSDDD